MKKVLFLAALALGAAACDSMGQGDIGEQSIKLNEQMADVIDKNKADCPKMGAELDAFVKDNEASFKKIAEAAKKESPDDKKKFDEKYKARSEAAMKKMTGGMTACATDPKVQAAMTRMGEVMSDKK